MTWTFLAFTIKMLPRIHHVNTLPGSLAGTPQRRREDRASPGASGAPGSPGKAQPASERERDPQRPGEHDRAVDPQRQAVYHRMWQPRSRAIDEPAEGIATRARPRHTHVGRGQQPVT